MSKNIRTGVTAINTFSECRMKWYFENVERIRPNSYDSAMEVGSLVHAFLEGYYSSIKADNSFPEEVHVTVGNTFLEDYIVKRQLNMPEIWYQQFDEDIILAEKLIENYLKYQETIFFDKILDVEAFHTMHNFRGTGVSIIGKLDMLVRLHDGRIALVDHKVKGSSGNEDEAVLPMDSQLNVYAMLVTDKYDVVPDVLIHNVIIRKLPETPKLLKKNGISRAATTLNNTTWQLYHDTIVKHGLDPHDYAKELAYIEDNGLQKYYNRMAVPVDRNILNNSFGELSIKAQAMRDAVDNNTCYRNNNVYMCKRCIYNTVCLAEMRDEDTEFAKKLLYRSTEDDL